MRVIVLYNDSERRECGEFGVARADESLGEELRVIENALSNLGYSHRTIPIQHQTPILHVANLVYDLRPDVVFNLVEAVRGDYGLEMAIPAMLDLMGVPYTGSNALTLGACQDKALSKYILMGNGVRTPKFYITSDPFLDHVWGTWPAIVKPAHEDGSLGITKDSVVSCTADLKVAIKNIELKYRQAAIVEEYIDGREFGVGVIDFNGGPVSFPVSEIVFDGYPKGIPRIVSYNSKWSSETVEYQESKPRCPADIDPELATRLQYVALGVFKLFNCRGYARVDTRVDSGGMIYVLEVNPNCDIAPGSGTETVLEAAGVSYEEFVKNIINGAMRGR